MNSWLAEYIIYSCAHKLLSNIEGDSEEKAEIILEKLDTIWYSLNEEQASVVRYITKNWLYN